MGKPNILLRSKKKKALACFHAGQYAEAWSLFQVICQADRLDADARLSCGVIAGLRGDNEVAESYCLQALTLDPKLAAAHYNLGIAQRSQGKFQEACQSFKQAAVLQVNYSEALDALAHAYISLYDWPAAAQVLNQIISIWPQKAEMYHNLGAVYQAMGRISDAIDAFEAALKIKPRLPGTLSSLGGVYMGQGDFELAERKYRQCLAANPADLRARSNLLMLLNYLPDADAVKVYEEHLEWGRVAAVRIPRLPPVEPAADSNRRFRLAYLSPDFREHSVASFIEPVLKHHDRESFEVYCYSDLPVPDETTHRLRRMADAWRDIASLSDSETADLIRNDKIDILVDLAGHTGNNRLGVFVAKPAKLQVTWIGYPNTTGLPAMDYRLTDGVADAGGEDVLYSEALLRLDGCFLCYQPESRAPEVGHLPALAAGHVTFGSFNNFSKINAEVLSVWSEVLRNVPGSRLLLKCPALTDEALRERVASAFGELGVGAERIDLLGHTGTREAHLAMYSRVDIALDTFPYNGTTTTCEALWMGVPVVSLAGKRHAGRVGASLLRAVGLQEWCADNRDAFVEISRAWAADTAALGYLRSTLRERMQQSSLCDARGFTRGLEDKLKAVLFASS